MMCFERMATSEHLISNFPGESMSLDPSSFYVLIYELPPSLLSLTAPTGPASCLQKMTTAEVNLYFHPELNGGRGGEGKRRKGKRRKKGRGRGREGEEGE